MANNLEIFFNKILFYDFFVGIMGEDGFEFYGAIIYFALMTTYAISIYINIYSLYNSLKILKNVLREYPNINRWLLFRAICLGNILIICVSISKLLEIDIRKFRLYQTIMKHLDVLSSLEELKDKEEYTICSNATNHRNHTRVS